MAAILLWPSFKKLLNTTFLNISNFFSLQVKTYWRTTLWKQLSVNFLSLRASSPDHSGGGAGKRRRACNYVSGIWICACEMLIGGDDISNNVITLGTCFSIFVHISARFRFALIQVKIWQLITGSHRGIGGRIQIPEKRRSCKLCFLFPPLRQRRLYFSTHPNMVLIENKVGATKPYWR